MTDYTLQAYIEHPDRPHDGGFTLPLPTTLETAQVFQDNLRISDSHVKIGEVYSLNNDDNNVSYWLNKALHDMEGPTSLAELNQLAAKIRGMCSDQREVFGAVLQAKRHTENIGQMIHLAENLDRYSLETAAYNANIYGEFRMTMEQDSTADSFKRLGRSQDPEDQRLAKYIERLEKCVDRSAYGEMIAKEEGGALTDYGYLTQVKSRVFAEKSPLEGKPSLIETLRANAKKSRERYGNDPPAQAKTKDKGEPSL